MKNHIIHLYGVNQFDIDMVDVANVELVPGEQSLKINYDDGKYARWYAFDKRELLEAHADIIEAILTPPQKARIKRWRKINAWFNSRLDLFRVG